MTKKNEVAVFDTSTRQMTRIPTSKISLYNPNNRLINSNGYLVATVNNVTDVADRTIIKIIDVSGDQPVIIPIKNAQYTHDQVTSVSVDAKDGIVAVASRANKIITAAKIAPLANQHVFDVSDYRGVSSFQIHLEDEVVTYADEDWKVRQLKLGVVPQAVTQEPIARSGNGFWVRKGRLVAVTKTDKVGSRYPMTITDSDAPPQVVPGTGTDIRGTSAKLGLAGSAAIAIDKTVFIAGTPGDSIGTGERLQMLTDNGWLPIQGEDGKPVWGSEVVTSMGFLAMKVRNSDGQTVIGYATYGERVELAGASASNSAAANRPKSASSTRPAVALPLGDDNPYNTGDEQRMAFLKTYLENEKQIGHAYQQAFGTEEGAKKTVEGIVKTMKQAGHEHLVDDYLDLSAFVKDSDRPGAGANTDAAANIDQQSVLSFLSGHWQAIRFSAQGQDLPDAAIEPFQLTFAGGQYVMNMGNELQTGSYEIDANHRPLSMTIHIESGKHKGQKRHGSFKPLKDNRLLMVFATNETEHPKKFVPDETGNSILAVYQKK